jgi:hypothetical protein
VGRVVSEFVFCTGRYASGDWDSAPLVPANLIDSVARYTSVAVAPVGTVVDVGSRDVLRYPLLYMTGHLPVRFTEAERRTLRDYTRRGGMIFMDDHNHDIGGIFHQTATEEIARTWTALRQLPNTHALYSSFFRFAGPPTTSHELNGWGDNLIHPHLSVVYEGDRIAVLYSNKDYSSEWSYHPDNKRFLAIDNTRFGVNIVVYAVTH